ncbi:hypothetical protein GTZ99_12315 [Novosphingobium sp. FSY-8]|uniref:Uncharacterized protein n=1 Tax=Novosphingobium ovatum TaxID=1908523 RepID=A0ABW9XFK3_9SPHN|nr:hypothetical protein [Novosphingobium ovatum]NBC37334.1 hypothetical protein [Novosphingobium ovatum]
MAHNNFWMTSVAKERGVKAVCLQSLGGLWQGFAAISSARETAIISGHFGFWRVKQPEGGAK